RLRASAECMSRQNAQWFICDARILISSARSGSMSLAAALLSATIASYSSGETRFMLMRRIFSTVVMSAPQRVDGCRRMVTLMRFPGVDRQRHAHHASAQNPIYMVESTHDFVGQFR